MAGIKLVRGEGGTFSLKFDLSSLAVEFESKAALALVCSRRLSNPTNIFFLNKCFNFEHFSQFSFAFIFAKKTSSKKNVLHDSISNWVRKMSKNHTKTNVEKESKVKKKSAGYLNLFF